MMEKIEIGNSDYSREEIDKGIKGWTIGNSPDTFSNTIKEYESEGYTVKFETSFFRRIFGVSVYKVVAYK